ncbi:MAG: hypothetical protein U0326_27600 [Polyangiales bacterium]
MHARLLRPARARLAEALAVVDGRDDAPGAWEALAAAGLIPMEWIHHPSRSYVVHAAGGMRRAYYPPTVEFCVLLAADADAAHTAELIARESLRDIRDADYVLWRFLDGPALQGQRSFLDAMLKGGSLGQLDRLVETGFCIDPMERDSIALLMPGEDPR